MYIGRETSLTDQGRIRIDMDTQGGTSSHQRAYQAIRHRAFIVSQLIQGTNHIRKGNFASITGALSGEADWIFHGLCRHKLIMILCTASNVKNRISV